MPVPFYILRVSCGFDAYGRPRSNIDFPLCLQMKLIRSHDDTSNFFLPFQDLYYTILQLVWIAFHGIRVMFIIEPCHVIFVEVTMKCFWQWMADGGGCWSFCKYVGCSSPFHCLAWFKADTWWMAFSTCQSHSFCQLSKSLAYVRTGTFSPI